MFFFFSLRIKRKYVIWVNVACWVWVVLVFWIGLKYIWYVDILWLKPFITLAKFHFLFILFNVEELICLHFSIFWNIDKYTYKYICICANIYNIHVYIAHILLHFANKIRHLYKKCIYINWKIICVLSNFYFSNIKTQLHHFLFKQSGLSASLHIYLHSTYVQYNIIELLGEWYTSS